MPETYAPSGMGVWSISMDDHWATSTADPPSVFGTDLHLELNGPRLRAGLMDALREAVRTGSLVPGTRLPSSR